VSAKAGWYPDPGGGLGLYRYWDGKAWSAATSPNAASPPPSLGIGSSASYGQAAYGQGSAAVGSSSHGYGSYGQASPYGQQTYGQQAPGGSSAYENLQHLQKKRSAIGWWITGAALVVVIVVVAVIAIRTLNNGGTITGVPGGQPSSQVCPRQPTDTPEPVDHPNDGRVHGGPVSYPELGSPWSTPQGDDRVPFGRDVQEQIVTIEPGYQPGSNWVASVLVGELQAGDGFFTPEQGSQIVVKCILGAFYGNNPVTSDVKVNKAMTIDGHDGWVVESQLSFDIPGLKAKGELLIVAIVTAKDSSGLYYASIPDNATELIPAARESLAKLKVDG
jgi:hypothetical protein